MTKLPLSELSTGLIFTVPSTVSVKVRKSSSIESVGPPGGYTELESI